MDSFHGTNRLSVNGRFLSNPVYGDPAMSHMHPDNKNRPMTPGVPNPRVLALAAQNQRQLQQQISQQPQQQQPRQGTPAPAPARARVQRLQAYPSHSRLPSPSVRTPRIPSPQIYQAAPRCPHPRSHSARPNVHTHTSRSRARLTQARSTLLPRYLLRDFIAVPFADTDAIATSFGHWTWVNSPRGNDGNIPWLRRPPPPQHRSPKGDPSTPVAMNVPELPVLRDVETPIERDYSSLDGTPVVEGKFPLDGIPVLEHDQAPTASKDGDRNEVVALEVNDRDWIQSLPDLS